MTPNGYTSKRSGPYWSNQSFLFYWHSGALALRTERQSARMSKNIQDGELDQYGPERFVRLTFATIRKNAGMKGLIRYQTSRAQRTALYNSYRPSPQWVIIIVVHVLQSISDVVVVHILETQVTWLVVTEVRSESFGLVTYRAPPL